MTNKGFTLIELLVVVAIIGILAAVGVVAYTGYTKSAKINAAKRCHTPNICTPSQLPRYGTSQRKNPTNATNKNIQRGN